MSALETTLLTLLFFSALAAQVILAVCLRVPKLRERLKLERLTGGLLLNTVILLFSATAMLRTPALPAVARMVLPPPASSAAEVVAPPVASEPLLPSAPALATTPAEPDRPAEVPPVENPPSSAPAPAAPAQVSPSPAPATPIAEPPTEPEAVPTPEIRPAPEPEAPILRTVYWTPGGRVYHARRDCSTLSRSTTVLSGTVSQAMNAGKPALCKVCGG